MGRRSRLAEYADLRPMVDVTFDPTASFVTSEDADMPEIVIAPAPTDLDATPERHRPVLVVHGR